MDGSCGPSLKQRLLFGENIELAGGDLDAALSLLAKKCGVTFPHGGSTTNAPATAVTTKTGAPARRVVSLKSLATPLLVRVFLYMCMRKEVPLPARTTRNKAMWSCAVGTS